MQGVKCSLCQDTGDTLKFYEVGYAITYEKEYSGSSYVYPKGTFDKLYEIWVNWGRNFLI